MASTPGRQPTFFLPHGGGPSFFMEWTMGPRDTWDRMEAFLRGVIATLDERPKAVVVISAHWEEPVFTVHTAPKPGLYYDYYNFPPHTYELKYPVPGDPALAQRIVGLLTDAGIQTRTESKRGLDHGVFIPFLLVLPDADIPIVQLSLKADMNAADHVAAGRALAPLRDENVLIVGSGMSFHNFRTFGRPEGVPASVTFDEWLAQTAEKPPAERDALLSAWDKAPAARESHPREEHLLPLMVAAGAAADDRGRRIYVDRVMGMQMSGHRFG